MELRTRKNLYGEPGAPAINAHLHSILQNEFDGWNGLHGSLIQEMGKAIQAQLDRDYPERYAVEPTKSMQIRDNTADLDDDLRKFIPDAVVFQVKPGTTPANPIAPMPTLTLRAKETVSADEFLSALTVREIVGGELGESITWIEVLSEANKVGGSGYRQYREKCAAVIAQNKSLVEFDFLHESSSPIGGVPSYRRKQPGATAYSIAVTDMRPLDDPAQRDKTYIYGFGVDEPIPVMYIPLNGNDAVRFDPGAAYNQAFEAFPIFGRRVDYEKWPSNLDRYQLYDQRRLALRRWLILNAETAHPVPLRTALDILAHKERFPKNFEITSLPYFDRSTGSMSWIGFYPDKIGSSRYIACVVRIIVDVNEDEPQVMLKRVGLGDLENVQALCRQIENALQNATSELEFLAQIDRIMLSRSPPDADE